MPRSFYRAVMTMHTDGHSLGIHVDTDGRLWAVDATSGQVGESGIDWHRLDEYLAHGYNVLRHERVGGMPRPAMLFEPISKDKVLDFIVSQCEQEGLRRLGSSGVPRNVKPTSKDWTLSKLLPYFDEQQVSVEARDRHLLLAWPDGSGPSTIDIRHALDVLGSLLVAHVSSEPMICTAKKGCSEPADTLLFLNAPACEQHATLSVKPKVEPEPVEWHDLMTGPRSNTPVFRVTRSGVKVLGLGMPPEDSQVRSYWKG